VTVQGDWVSDAVATFNAIDQNGGRLTAYQLNETGTQVDQTTFTSLWKGRNWRSTSIALSAQIPQFIPTGSTVRVHSDVVTGARSASTSTSIRLEVANMDLSQLQSGIEPFAVQFMPRAFPDDDSFSRWASTGNLLTAPGNTLVSLDVSLPAAYPLAWLNNTVTDPKDPIYQKLSIQLQALLKRYLRDYYFRDFRNYKDLQSAYLVLLYAAIPLSNAVQIENGAFSSLGNGIYWNPTEIDTVSAMAQKALDSGAFQRQLATAQTRLLAAGLTDLAKSYDPSDGFDVDFKMAMNSVSTLQNPLLLAETNVVLDAYSAAQDAANFNALAAANQPADAIKKLTDFGLQIAAAFNNDLSTVFSDNDALQRVSPLIFAQAATVFDASLPAAPPFDATLNVTVLKPGAAMPPAFPDFTVNPGDALVSLNAASFGISALAAMAATAGKSGD
jgi:hypothetical protein